MKFDSTRWRDKQVTSWRRAHRLRATWSSCTPSVRDAEEEADQRQQQVATVRRVEN